jgi:hypothetical protein
MEVKEIRKLIKEEFKDIQKLYGFHRRTGILYIKITDDCILQDICFQLRRDSLTCEVAMQPLYAYNDIPGLTFNFGTRIGHFKHYSTDWWQFENATEGIKCLKEVKLLLVEHAMPWFEQYGTPEGIIDFIQQDKDEEYGFYHLKVRCKEEFLAFSLLYLGNIQAGLTCLENYVQTMHSKDEYWVQYRFKLQSIIDSISQDPNITLKLLQGFVSDNKSLLKLD